MFLKWFGVYVSIRVMLKIYWFSDWIHFSEFRFLTDKLMVKADGVLKYQVVFCCIFYLNIYLNIQYKFHYK